MLPALATGAVGINPQIFRLDYDFNAVIDFRRNVNAGKRCMPALRLIERRDAHQAVDADFAGQQTERVLSIYREGSRLQPRFFAGLVIIKHGLEAPPLGPAKIHSLQHVGPIL